MLIGAAFLFTAGCKSPLNDEYQVAAYVWPSCHDESRSRDVLWPEGIGEWEIIKKGDPRFEGHYQPRVPLWGYAMDDDPVAMVKKINAAADHGVNMFVFDWYWYDGEPFLESTLNNGFLKAPNNDRMQFYIMWANHDVPGTMWNRYRYDSDTIIWVGEVNWEDYKVMVERIIRQYFRQPNYFKIEGKPVFSIFSFQDLVNSFNGLEGTKEALDYFREEVIKDGLPGLHLQLISRRPMGHAGLIGEEYARGKGLDEIIDYLGINSMTTYNWRMSGIDEDYIRWAENGIAMRNRWDSLLDIPYFPCVSIGWDNTPRYAGLGRESVVHTGNTPESFAAYLQQAKDYLKDRPDQPKLILINAWNEWVEGAYLEPDMKWGYGYLEAVKKVMSGRYDTY
ncbi:MAG: hypothetical protein AMS26_05210 [Bacteroides sp. SM23_62]|nr:MAG: hypothetical protein AMS26_05210 [Bacteroides sp. SM23_62]